VNEEKSYARFCKVLLMSMVTAGTLVGLILLCFRGVSHANADYYHDSASRYNHFWLMVSGNHPVEKSQLGAFAQDVRSYLGLPFSKDVQPKISSGLFCKSDLYPELGKDMGDSLFSAETGGFVQPAFLKDIDTFKQGGLKSVIREEIRNPITLDPDTIAKANKAIAAYNRMWNMVAGKQPCDATSEGRLATDLRDYLKINGEGTPTVFTTKVCCAPSAYGDIAEMLKIPIFASGESTGLMDLAFLARVDQCKNHGAQAVLHKVPPRLGYDEALIFGWQVHLLSVKTLFFWWTLVGLTAFLALRGSSLDWDVTPDEKGWKLLSACLVPSFFLGRLVWLMPVGAKAATKAVRAYSAEMRHPYRKERMIARESLKRLSRLPKQNEEVEKQRLIAEAILREVTPAQPDLRSNDEFISKLVSSTVGAQLEQAQASMDAKKEVASDIK
jgi:hypothetical protein